MAYSYTNNVRRRKIEGVLSKLDRFRLSHRNIIFMSASFVFFYIIITREGIAPIVAAFGDFGYIGAFVSGFLFSYGFTVLPAASTIYLFGGALNVFIIALAGAIGATIGDIFIFRFIRFSLTPEIKYIISHDLHLDLPSTRRIMSHPRIRKILPAIAGIIIALPIPVEVGMVMLGAVNYTTRKVAVMAFLLNFVGIFFIALLGSMA
jgi:hypothetical protein